jgi:hypothetical protein
MADDRASRFPLIPPGGYPDTLAGSFIGLADDLRQISVEFGMKPYTVRRIRIQWSGGARGRGLPTVIFSEPILPTPKVTDISGLSELLHSVGLDEHGSLRLSEISGTYTEDDLRGLDAQGKGPAVDVEFFYEIEYARPDGLAGEKRRFYPSGAAAYNAGKLQWTLTLEKSNEDRTRDGSIR